MRKPEPKTKLYKVRKVGPALTVYKNITVIQINDNNQTEHVLKIKQPMYAREIKVRPLQSALDQKIIVDIPEHVKRVDITNGVHEINEDKDGEVVTKVRMYVKQQFYNAEVPEGYNVLTDCQLDCHQDCLALRGKVPFAVLQECVELKCQCVHDVPFARPAGCSEQCSLDCLDPQRALGDVFQCVQSCGCSSQRFVKLVEDASSSSHVNNMDDALLQEGHLQDFRTTKEVYSPCSRKWVDKVELKESIDPHEPRCLPNTPKYKVVDGSVRAPAPPPKPKKEPVVFKVPVQYKE